MAVQATGAMAIVVADVPAVHHGRRSGARALHAFGAHRRRHARGRLLPAGLGAPLRVELGDGRLHQRRRRQHRPRPARELHRLQRLGREPADAGAEHAHPSGTSSTGRRSWSASRRSCSSSRSSARALGAMGLVVAVVATSALVPLLGWSNVATLSDLTAVPNSLPRPVLPVLHLVPVLIVPAIALTFVGLVQGAVISASLPNPDGTIADASSRLHRPGRRERGLGSLPRHAGRRLAVGLVAEQDGRSADAPVADHRRARHGDRDRRLWEASSGASRCPRSRAC